MDNHDTTRLDPRVLEAMMPYLTEKFGNPASCTYRYGWDAQAAVENARKRAAKMIGARPEETVLTSGATESDNLAIKGAARTGPPAFPVRPAHRWHPVAARWSSYQWLRGTTAAQQSQPEFRGRGSGTNPDGAGRRGSVFGFACTSTTDLPSYILQALGSTEELALASVRFGLGRFNSPEEMDFGVGRVVEIVKGLRNPSVLPEAGASRLAKGDA